MSSDLLEQLAQNLSHLPGIGPKSAMRLVFHLLQSPAEQTQKIAQLIHQLTIDIHRCHLCANFASQDPCWICQNTQRHNGCICVVEQVLSLLSLEKSKTYQGLYFVLHGHLDPLEGIGPEQLGIPLLLKRVQQEQIREVILATNPNLEGDVTAQYIHQTLKDYTKVTRLSYGLPVGSHLDSIDHLTLSKAFSDRNFL